MTTVRVMLLACLVVFANLASAQDFSHIFRKVDPAVVVILTKEEKDTLTLTVTRRGSQIELSATAQ